jgi:hypothetical protein
MKELIEIQAKLNAPKNQRNKFGGYNYRSCEDILGAVKDHLKESKCTLLLSDEIKEIGSPYIYETNDTKKGSASSYNGTRIYVEATATLVNSDGESVSVKAYAREELVKSGMDASQITGAASSYARKYALCGLFAIDDTKDADATNTHGKDKQEQPKQEQQEVDKDKLRANPNGQAPIVGDAKPIELTQPQSQAQAPAPQMSAPAEPNDLPF